MKPQEQAVMALIFHHPDARPIHLSFWITAVKRSGWYYWTRRLQKKGWIEGVYHAHGSYSWTGYKLTEQGKQIYLDYALRDIPF